MTTRLLVFSGLSAWLGATLLLSGARWFRVAPLVERLRPYAPPRSGDARARLLSAETLRDLLGPMAIDAGNRIARLFGVNDELSARLARVGGTTDATAFRLRQVGWASGALVATALLAVAAGLPAPLAAATVLGAPVLAFLVLEQQLSAASQRWQTQVLLELPVVIEQLGMLFSSGYSIGAAVQRLGSRGRGACAGELARVSNRIRQGVHEIAALREWATRSDVAAVDRLVGILALNWEAGDLGALISAEARAVRREVQRRELELIDRRAQQVWIPVTVATLLPGVIFMAVPFVDAMGKLTGR